MIPENRICERVVCREPITIGQAAVNPGWGFGWFHTICWLEEQAEIKHEHIQADVDSQHRESEVISQ